MNPLEKCIEQILDTPTSELDSRILDEDIAGREIRAVIDEEWAAHMAPKMRKSGARKMPARPQEWNSWPVETGLLTRLLEKLRGSACERSVWEAVLGFLSHALPDAMAHDLIDRRGFIFNLGQPRQSDDVLWRLAAMDDHPVLTLARKRYFGEEYGFAEFEDVVRKFSACRWMLDNLLHVGRSESMAEGKFDIVLKYVARHPDRDQLLNQSGMKSVMAEYLKSHPGVGE